MSELKQQYEKMVVARSWDKDTQIRFFLEYAQEYNLGDHFLSYLGLKPAPNLKVMTPSDHYSFEQLIRMVIKNETVTNAIQDNSLVTRDMHPWSVQDVIKCVASCMSITVDPENKQLVQELLAYFNLKHAFFVQPDDAASAGKNSKQEPPEDLLDNMYARYAHIAGIPQK